MAWDGKDDRRISPHSCNPTTCQYHYLTEHVVSDLKVAVEKLLEGQIQMKETVIQLSENMKAFERIEQRLEKLEDWQIQRDKEQDQKIQELRAFMYKAMGAISAVGVIASFALKFLGG